MARRYFGQLDQLGRPGERAGRVDQGRRQAQRALLDRLTYEPLHHLNLRGVRLDVAVSEHQRARRCGAEERSQVQRGAKPLEVAVQIAPVDPDAVAVVERLHLDEQPRSGRRDRLALAGDLGGDALADLRLDAVVGEEEALRLAEHVDEARRHHAVAQLDAPACAGARQVAHRGYAIAPDAHVGAEPRSAGAVDDSPAGEHQIENDGQGNYQGASRDRSERASATVAGSRPTSRAMRTALSTSSPFDLAICVPSASR